MSVVALGTAGPEAIVTPPPPVLATAEAASTVVAATAARTTSRVNRQPTLVPSFRQAPLASATGYQCYRAVRLGVPLTAVLPDRNGSQVVNASSSRRSLLASGTPAPTNSMLPASAGHELLPAGRCVRQRRAPLRVSNPYSVPLRVEVKTTPSATVAQPNSRRWELHGPDRRPEARSSATTRRGPSTSTWRATRSPPRFPARTG